MPSLRKLHEEGAMVTREPVHLVQAGGSVLSHSRPQEATFLADPRVVLKVLDLAPWPRATAVEGYQARVCRK